MLVHQTLDKLDSLGLQTMAATLRGQLEQPAQYHELTFEDRLGLLVDRELAWRESRRLTTRLKAARLRHQAVVEDIDFRSPRGLDRSVVLSMAQAGWVSAHQNLLLTVVPADKAAKPGRAAPPCGPIGDDPINRLAG